MTPPKAREAAEEAAKDYQQSRDSFKRRLELHNYHYYGFLAGAEYQAAITREETIREVPGLLRGDEAKQEWLAAYNSIPSTFVPTPSDYADWLEKRMKKPNGRKEEKK